MTPADHKAFAAIIDEHKYGFVGEEEFLPFIEAMADYMAAHSGDSCDCGYENGPHASWCEASDFDRDAWIKECYGEE